MANSEVIPASGKAPEFPEHVDHWNNWIRANNHCSTSLQIIKPKSASKITVAQFYMLRTLYIKPQSSDRLEKDLSIDYNKAKTALANCPLWKDYRNSFTEGYTSRQMFGLARLYQQRSAHLLIGNRKTRRAFYLYKPEELCEAQVSVRAEGEEEEEEADLERTLITESSFLSEISTVEYDTIEESHGVEDEEIVNFALVLFANSLIRATSSVDVDGDWLPCRSSFKVKFENKKLYRALVDGIFRVEKVSEEKTGEQLKQCQRLDKTGSTTSQANGNDESTYKLSTNSRTTAIMEVKRKSRSNTENWCVDIFYQEAGEMAAWIAEVPVLLDQKPDHDGTYRRLLLSQDQREVYVTIATYTEKYISYILHSVHKPAYAEGTLTTDDFLRMYPYGPFRVDVLEDMEQLARVLIALSYQNFVI
ncbi:hypothetical protein BBO_02317 [Beauveria brongniartii RCEF 3172]|uniref:Uncharacterized protein n=1 Tax=Beauveria brongniartii RCEF 3172 TaxID=1081107 RepID=A0A162JRL5_9HYPO|nr:hypothetical protein BBO_02317 [Beauveria brongniartii RCEF 3172]